MVFKIVLTVKLVRHGQIKIGYVPENSSASARTIFGLSTTTATVNNLKNKWKRHNMVFMIVLTVKLVQHGQIKIGHVPVISSALVSTNLGHFDNHGHREII
jgi:hypothetical protein